jgi:hypothetical protein
MRGDWLPVLPAHGGCQITPVAPKNGELTDAVRTKSYSPASIFLVVQQLVLATVNGARCSLLYSFWTFLDPWEMAEAILSGGKVAPV